MLCFNACSSDFLDREPSDLISDSKKKEEADKNLEKVLSPMMYGVYSTTFTPGTGGTVGPYDDDFGQKSIDICMDLMCGDMAMSGTSYGYFVDDYRFVDQAKTGMRAYSIWKYYYKIIMLSNEILDLLGGDDEMPDTDAKKAYYGQAKAMRAYAYFYLVNLYQHPYSEKKDKPGVPVYRTQVGITPKGQSTVGEVYELIIKDLEDAAIALENYTRPEGSKTEIDKYVAYGLLANACLFTGDYQKAIAAVGKVIDRNNFSLMSASEILESGFSSVTIPGWMWAIDITADNTGKLKTFWAHVDIFTYGYAAVGDRKCIDNVLYESILSRPNDIRKNQFSPEEKYAPINKFFDAARTVNLTRSSTNDIVYMRVEEIYLLKAEAHARAGEDDKAKAVLKTLVELRDADGAERIDKMNNAELLEEIYYNWRVEMWGEGKSYFAMKRYKKTVTRGSNHVVYPGDSKPYNHSRMIYEIPQSEISNNRYIVPQQD